MTETLQKELRLLPAPHPTPHGQNLAYKLRQYYGKDKRFKEALDLVVPAYIDFRRSLGVPDALDAQLEQTVKALDEYLTILRQPEVEIFISQGDFLTSALPEFFLHAFGEMTARVQSPFRASGQRDILIDIALDVLHPGRVVPRTQRVDVAVLEPVEMSVGGRAIADFAIPIIVAEVKTYYDKNMISGVAFSFGSLKSTFPGCLCLAISEFADFAPEHQSYAAAAIDEIYILRQQKRSEFRTTGVARNIDPQLVKSILAETNRYILKLSTPRPDLHQRLATGSLIREGARA
jgi:hypothetical protein